MRCTQLLRRLGFWIGAVLVVVAGRGATAWTREPLYVVVVHPSNPVNELDRTGVARFFLKKSTRWPDGRQVRPVDLAGDSAVRRAFADDILGRSVGAVRAFWQQAIFSGRDVPPPEMAGPEAVIEFVLSNEGAIGYTQRNAELRGAKVVGVR